MPSPILENPDAPRGASPSARRRGRRIATGVFWAITAAVALASAVQVTRQVLFDPCPGGLSCTGAPAPASMKTCREGLLALHAAVERARRAAAGTDGEDAALARFRAALTPEWGYRDDVAGACRGAAEDEGALDAIERLRYAEEHAVRREAGELAPLRRRVEAIVDRELSRPGTPSSAPGHPTPSNPP
jgi:hypothetical protein